MPAEERNHDLVVRIDLRQDWQGIAARGSLEPLVRETLQASGLEHAGLARALVIGSASTVSRELAAYERIRTAIEFDAVLYFLVGPPEGDAFADGATGEVVEDPLLLMLPPTAAKGGVVWAGDTPGIGWQPGKDRAVVYGASSETDGADPYAPLIEVLSLPEIFDGVLDGLKELPKSVCGVGTRMLVHDLPADRLRRLLRQAVEQLAQPSGGSSPSRATPTDLGGALGVLTADLPPGVTAGQCLVRGGHMAALDEDCARRLADLEVRFAELREPMRLITSGPRSAGLETALAEAGAALETFKRQVVELLAVVNGTDGLSAGTKADLAAIGVELPEVPDVAPRPVATALRAVLADGLDRRLPLRDTAATLSALARRLAPTGSAIRVERAEAASPDTLAARMAAPPPFRIRAAGLFGLPAGALVGLLGGWSSAVGFVLGPTLAVTLAILDRLMVERCPVPRSRVGNGAQAGWSASAGLAGAVVGIIAGHATGLPSAVGYATSAAALLLAVVVTVRRWLIAVDDWYDAIGVGRAARAHRVLHDELAAAVIEDWLLADARLRASDEAKALGIAVQRIADVLAVRPDQPGTVLDVLAAPGPGPGDPGDADSEPDSGADGGGELERTLVGDVADLVAEVLAANWPAVGGDPRAAAKLSVEADLRSAVNRLWRHLRRHGVAEPPRPRDGADRPDPARLAGLDPARVREAVLADDSSPEVRQLCTLEQLRMLESEPDFSRWVRFAHRTLRETLAGGDVWDTDRTGDADRSRSVVWTTSSRFAGAVRLTPLKPNAARLVHDRLSRRNPEGRPV